MKYQTTITLRSRFNPDHPTPNPGVWITLQTPECPDRFEAASDADALVQANRLLAIMQAKYGDTEIKFRALHDITEHDVYPYCTCPEGLDCPGPRVVEWTK